MLISLDNDGKHRDTLVLRRGRVIGWVEDALAPLRHQLSAKEMRRVVRAVRAAAGLEALIWLCDVAELSREESVSLMKWSARALLDAAISDADRRKRARGRH